jgi:pyruvate dehydrogenase E2 component (dihydrolipoamide acetyltransferase)
MGGAVATVTAARGFTDVRSLVLISSAGLGPQINGAFLEGLVRAKSEASVTPWLKELFADEALLSKAFINATVAQANDAELRNAQADMAAQLCTDGTQTFEIRSSLAQLNIPVRLIFGAQDRIIPVAHAAGLPGEIGVHVFQKCGHMPQIEQRDAVLRIISECSKAAHQNALRSDWIRSALSTCR